MRAVAVEGLDGELVDPGGEVGGQSERGAGGDQDEAVGAFRDEGADLLGVGGVVQHDRHRQGRQMLVIQLTQPFDLLVLGGAFTEEKLVAGAPRRFSRCISASRVDSGVSSGLSARRSTTQAPRK